jgi:hypothetical protein
MTAARRLPGNALFHLVMIKPSHCDDDGYPVQWIRSAIPSNTLACMNALAKTRSDDACSGRILIFDCTPMNWTRSTYTIHQRW